VVAPWFESHVGWCRDEAGLVVQLTAVKVAMEVVAGVAVSFGRGGLRDVASGDKREWFCIGRLSGGGVQGEMPW
jgi:hypothetical protein